MDEKILKEVFGNLAWDLLSLYTENEGEIDIKVILLLQILRELQEIKQLLGNTQSITTGMQGG